MNSKKELLDYFEENKHVSNLEIKQGFDSVKQSFETRSTLVTINNQLTAWFMWAKWLFWRFRRNYYQKTLVEIRNSKKGNTALILGNGPSQESLPTKTIERYINSGGDIILCNFYFFNPKLANFQPTIFVSSDPNIFHSPYFSELKNRLAASNDLQIYAPTHDVAIWQQEVPTANVTGFCDQEITQGFAKPSKNIDPRKPRGYSSMTLYKALAMACWLGYSKIYILGMDNTYPRDIYCNSKNELLQRERHAGEDDYMVNRSNMFDSIFDYLYVHSLIFKDLSLFKNHPIVNLDPYSLTDSFDKVESYEKGWDALLNS